MMFGKSVSVISAPFSPLLPELPVTIPKARKRVKRQLSPPRILNAGLKGGTLVGRGKKLTAQTMEKKGSKWTVSTTDDQGKFNSAGSKNNPVAPVLVIKYKLKLSKKTAAKIAKIIESVPQKDLIWS